MKKWNHEKTEKKQILKAIDYKRQNGEIDRIDGYNNRYQTKTIETVIIYFNTRRDNNKVKNHIDYKLDIATRTTLCLAQNKNDLQG